MIGPVYPRSSCATVSPRFRSFNIAAPGRSTPARRHVLSVPKGRELTSRRKGYMFPACHPRVSLSNFFHPSNSSPNNRHARFTLRESGSRSFLSCFLCVSALRTARCGEQKIKVFLVRFIFVRMCGRVENEKSERIDGILLYSVDRADEKLNGSIDSSLIGSFLVASACVSPAILFAPSVQTRFLQRTAEGGGLTRRRRTFAGSSRADISRDRDAIKSHDFSLVKTQGSLQSRGRRTTSLLAITFLL